VPALTMRLIEDYGPSLAGPQEAWGMENSATEDAANSRDYINRG